MTLFEPFPENYINSLNTRVYVHVYFCITGKYSSEESYMPIFTRREFNQILEVVLHDSSSSTYSGSEDNNLDLLLLEFDFAYP